MTYIVQRQPEQHRAGNNRNLLQRQVIDVPTELSDRLPKAGIRLSLHHPVGCREGFTLPMVSLFLIPRNGSTLKGPVYLETVTLTPGEGYRLGQLYQCNGVQAREAVEGSLTEILQDYLHKPEQRRVA